MAPGFLIVSSAALAISFHASASKDSGELENAPALGDCRRYLTGEPGVLARERAVRYLSDLGSLEMWVTKTVVSLVPDSERHWTRTLDAIDMAALGIKGQMPVQLAGLTAHLESDSANDRLSVWILGPENQEIGQFDLDIEGLRQGFRRSLVPTRQSDVDQFFRQRGIFMLDRDYRGRNFGYIFQQADVDSPDFESPFLELEIFRINPCPLTYSISQELVFPVLDQIGRAHV